MKKILKNIMLISLPLSTAAVTGAGVYFSTSTLVKEDLHQSDNNTNDSNNSSSNDGNILTNYTKWIDSGLSTPTTSYGEQANAILAKYNNANINQGTGVKTISNAPTNDNFYKFAVAADFAEDKLQILANGLQTSNTTIMDTCRLVVQKMFIVVKGYIENQNEQLLTMFQEVSDALVEKYFRYGDTEIGNWWNYEIGVPKDYLKSLCYVYDKFDSEKVQKWLKPIKWFKATCAYKFDITGAQTQPMKSANLIDGAYSVILYSAIDNNEAKIEETINLMLNSIFAYWKKDNIGDNRNGFYEDGSYIDHSDTTTKTGGLAYFAGYGIELIKGLLDIKQMVENTKFDLNNYSLFDKFYQIVETNIMPYMYELSLTDTLSGRSISRANHDEKTNGKTLINLLIDYVDDAPIQYKSRLVNFILDQLDWDVPEKYMTQKMKDFKTKYNFYQQVNDRFISNNWIETNHFNRWDNANVDNLIPIGIDLFNANNKMLFSKNQDRYTTQTDDYMFNLALVSNRTYHYEAMNGENLYGYYQGDGLTLINNKGLNNYGDNYWTAIDPFKLPGTSAIYEIDNTKVTDEQIEANQKIAEGSDKKLTSQYGNGINYGNFGIVSSRVRNYNNTLSTDKTYIFIDGIILVIGNVKRIHLNQETGQIEDGVSSSTSSIKTTGSTTINYDTQPIYTTVLNDMNSQLIESTVSSSKQQLKKFSSLTNSYYILPESADIVVNNNISRTVKPKTVNAKRTSEQDITRSFSEVYFDHTKKVSTSSSDQNYQEITNNYFAYIIAPAETNEAATINKINNISIINNGKDNNGFVVEYNNANESYSFISTFANNQNIKTNNLDLTFEIPTTCLIKKNNTTNEYGLIFSPNENISNYTVSINEIISKFDTRSISGISEVTFKDNKFNINNKLYWNSDILHNTWVTFKK